MQPPKREDLQPSYAQTLSADADPVTHGWYGAMSTCAENAFTTFNTDLSQSTLSAPLSDF